MAPRTATPDGIARVSRLRDELLPLSATLVRRAKQSGAIREDVAPTDLAIVQIMIGAVLDAAREADPEVWRRYLAIILRGLSARPEELGSLPVGALGPDQIPRVMTHHKLGARPGQAGAPPRAGKDDQAPHPAPADPASGPCQADRTAPHHLPLRSVSPSDAGPRERAILPEPRTPRRGCPA